MGVFKDLQGAECGWVKQGQEPGAEIRGMGDTFGSLGGQGALALTLSKVKATAGF